MFGFLRRKKPPPPTPSSEAAPEAAAADAATVIRDEAGLVVGAPVADAPAPQADSRPEDSSAQTIGAPSETPRRRWTMPWSTTPKVASPESKPQETAPEPTTAAASSEAVEPDVVPAPTPELSTEPREQAPEPLENPSTADPEAVYEPILTDRTSWMSRLRQGLSKTRGNLAGLFSNTAIDENLYDELETALLVSDAGVETTTYLLTRLREKVRRERIADAEGVRKALKALLAELLRPLERPIDIDAAKPLVMMIAGVNGAGKTTSIGKLARHLQLQGGKSVLLAAGDTFRAAAREQLVEWGRRNDVQVIAQQGGDPAAVAFDAVQAGRARGTGVVIIDTAGRLPTQLHLMDELKKIHRVVGKAMDGAPHETLVVLDGNTGQNMLAQVKAFDEAIGLTGLIVTKLDGTARGGTLAALAHTRRDHPIPVCFIGVGEGIEDLQGFSADEFAAALLD